MLISQLETSLSHNYLGLILDGLESLMTLRNSCWLLDIITKFAEKTLGFVKDLPEENLVLCGLETVRNVHAFATR